MASDLLSLKWNNHNSAFFHLLLKLCLKEAHSDTTIACQGKYFPAHKLVLSSCSKYFEEIFERTRCKHPFIIINDLDPLEFEALMKYMYRGEVNVQQNRLPALIKAAEALNIKGLAIPDEMPTSTPDNDCNEKKRKLSEHSPNSKRKRKMQNESQEQKHTPAAPDIAFNNVLYKTSEPAALSCSNECIKTELDPPKQINIKDEPEEEKIYLGENEVKFNESNQSVSETESYSATEHSQPPFADPLQIDLQEQSLLPSLDIGYSTSCNQTLSLSSKNTKDLLTPPSMVLKRPSRNDAMCQLNNFTTPKKSVTGERRTFRCHYCSYISFNRTHTINHMRRHTGEKPFICSHCLKRFSLKHNLDRHVKSHKQGCENLV